MRLARHLRLPVTLGCIVALAAAGTAVAGDGQRYAVTVTNLTRGQVL